MESVILLIIFTSAVIKIYIDYKCIKADVNKHEEMKKTLKEMHDNKFK